MTSSSSLEVAVGARPSLEDAAEMTDSRGKPLYLLKNPKFLDCALPIIILSSR
jgi:hypothetical protein